MMRKTALITGSTDGIGRAVALELARKGFTLHILGRNEQRGKETLDELKAIRPDSEHELFLVDLATIAENSEFLDSYVESHDRLDLLVLNANAFTKRTSLTEDSIETTFAVGCVSRYMFSVKLSSLLSESEDARVIHIGSARGGREINYEAVTSAKYGIMKSTFQSYSGDALLACFLNRAGKTKVPHELISPGTVNTRQIKEQIFIVRLLARIFGLIEPEESGRRIVNHIISTSSSDVAGKYYSLEKEGKISKKLANRQKEFDKLIAFCEAKTNVEIKNMI